MLQILLFLFFFLLFFPGLFVFSVGPRPNRNQAMQKPKVSPKIRFFTYSALFRSQHCTFFRSQQRVKEFSWFTFSITCIGFFWSVLGFVAFVGKLRLRADRQASCRCYRLRRLRWPLHIWTPAQLKDGDSCKWVSPLNCAWPDDLTPGSKDLHNLRLLHDARTNNKTIQLQEVQRVSNINYITTV